MPKYNSIAYRDNYSKKYGILWHYCRDESAVDANDTITDLNEANATKLFYLRAKIID